jgi:Trypsin-co-occurring domain 1
MSEIARVMLPSGELIWVRTRMAEPVTADESIIGPADVRLSPARLLGFSETVRGVVTSVEQSFAEHRPDSVVIEFGIEIVIKTGGLISALADVGGTAQVKVTASWDRDEGRPRLAAGESDAP